MNEQAQQLLDQLMDNFDFAKVARVMLLLDWRWASVQGHGVPDEPHLRARVRSYAQDSIRQALNNTGHKPGKGFVGTGGFHLEAEAENGQLTSLYVRFELIDFVAWPTTEEPAF